MARITIGTPKEPLWKKYATIELSKREAALLVNVMTKCNGAEKLPGEIYQGINDLYRDCGIETINVYDNEELCEYLSTLGEE